MNVYLTFSKGYHKIPQSHPKSHLADRMSYCRAVPFFVTLHHKTTDYDPLEEHTDSDSSRPEVQREGSLPFPRGSPCLLYTSHSARWNRSLISLSVTARCWKPPSRASGTRTNWRRKVPRWRTSGTCCRACLLYTSRCV